MFNVGPEKLVLLFVIALVVLGPRKLPDAARSLGRAFGEFRKVSGHLQREVHEALSDPKDALSAAVSDLRSEFGDFRGGIGDLRGGIADLGNHFGLGGPAMTAPVGEQPSAAAPGSVSSSTPLPPPPDDPSLN